MSTAIRYLLLIFTIVISISINGQTITFGFEVSDGSYDNTDYGDWYAANSQTYGSSKQYSGDKALVFDDDAGAYLLYQGSDDNGKDGGLGEVSFWYRHWDGDGSNVRFKVQYNQNGAGWTDIGTEVIASSTTYIQYSANVNLAGDNILFRILSTAYAERPLIDDIILTDFGSSVGGPIILEMTDDGNIAEGSENGELITIIVHGDTLKSTLNISSWTTFNLPTGVAISNLVRVNDTTATFQLNGNRTVDYDVDISNFTLTASSSQLKNSTTDLTVITGVVFIALNDAESISMTDDGSILEDLEDGEIVEVKLNGGSFAQSLNPAKWTLTGAPSGVGIGSVVRTNDSIVSLTLSGNASADYDSDISNAVLSVDYSQVDDMSAGSLVVNSGITFIAAIEGIPTVQTSNIGFPLVGSTQITIDWTRGNGEYCLVLASEDIAITDLPIDGINYNASTIFGNGDNLGSDNYVVYNGTGNSATITGITQGKTYHFRVFEFNNTGVNTKYLTTTATGNPSLSYTKPNDITDFSLVCISKSSAHLTWTLPSGNYEGIIIAARQSTNPVHTISSGQGDTIAASNTFGNGYMFGSTSPNSFVVYNGTGNSVSINGLTPGQSYTFKAYTYQDSLWSNGTTKTAQVAEIKEITNLSHYAPNQEIIINWDNPSFNCPDEVMVVMKQGSAITTSPSGNGTNYTASAVFGSGTDIGIGEYVVYKGQADGLTVSGLTNGLPYHFSIFVRDDTVWSNGVADFDTPNDITILFQGDLAVVAINTNYLSSGSDDEISFVCFDTLKTGTAIDFTDNGWERANAGYWGGTEGVIRITRTGAAILPGEIITIRGSGHVSTDFTVTGLSDNGWTVSSLNGNYDLNLNTTDQLWMMQYGSWSGGGSSQLGVYTGNVLFGWSATGWAGDVGHGTGTSYSALYPLAECFNTNVVNTSSKDKVKYTGDTAATTQREWIARINNPSNWTGYSSNALYNAGPDYPNGIRFSIIQNTYDDGEWVGDEDTNWFNCSNWGGLKVPDENTHVIIDTLAKRACIIDIAAEYSDDFQDTAVCNSLIINDSTLMFNSGALKVIGDLEINGGNFLLNSSAIILQGDLINNSSTAFDGSSGLIRFEGDAQQNIHNNSTTLVLDQVEINNAYHLNLWGDLQLNILNFSTGKAFLHTNSLTIIDSIIGYSTSSYVVMENIKNSTGLLIMNLTTANRVVPIGNSNGYNPILAQLATGSANFQFRIFDSIYANGITGAPLVGDMVNKTWIVEPSISGTYSVNLRLQWNLSDESGQFSLSRTGAQLFNNNLQGINPTWNSILGGGPVQGTNPFRYSKNSITSFGAFSIGDNCLINKPVTSIIHHF